MASNPEYNSGIKSIILDFLSWTRVAIVESAEVMASYQVGQFFIKYTDKVLWLIEKSSQWSLPPPTKNEEKSLVMSELTRPLPWVFFLPTLLILRLFRESVSIVLFLLGSQPLKPSQMVRFVQNLRRSLRAIKYHGIRSIRMKNQKKASKVEEDDICFSDWIYNKIHELLCYKVVRYSNGKQPKAIQDRRNSGEMVVCKEITKNKKRPLDDSDGDNDMDETFDADSALRELASKVDLLPESDSDDTEYSLVNVSNNLDTSCTSTDDDDDDDDDQPEDQQVHEESENKPDHHVEIEIESGTSATLDETSEISEESERTPDHSVEIEMEPGTSETLDTTEISIQSEKKPDPSVHLEKKSDQSRQMENQVGTTAQSESKKPDSSTQLENKLDSSVESDRKKVASVKSEKKPSSSVQIKKDTSKTVKTETQNTDKIVKTENQPASDKTVRTEMQADSSLNVETIPTAGAQNKGVISGDETRKHINVAFIESESQTSADANKGIEKNISSTKSTKISPKTVSVNNHMTKPRRSRIIYRSYQPMKFKASIPKEKSVNPQPETTVTETTGSSDDINRSAVKTTK